MTKEWKDGLPPVGCECMFLDKRNPHPLSESAVKIIMRTVYVIVMQIDVDWGDSSEKVEIAFNLQDEENLASCFHPIKSKQDIEREAEIDKMLALDPFTGIAALTSRTDFCHKLIDAGYRNNGEEVSYDDLRQKIRLDRDTPTCSAIVAELIKNFKIYPRNP